MYFVCFGLIFVSFYLFVLFYEVFLLKERGRAESWMEMEEIRNWKGLGRGKDIIKIHCMEKNQFIIHKNIKIKTEKKTPKTTRCLE